MTESLSSDNRMIARAAGVVMAGFVLSNLTGLVRQVLVSRIFGTQAEIDASRANAMAPYQQIGFMSDIIQGAPIGTAQTTFSPGASPFQQATGAAITMGSLQRAGIFG